MEEELIELNSDYLLRGSQQTTAAGLVKLSGAMKSHDGITRFLSGEKMDEKTVRFKARHDRNR